MPCSVAAKYLMAAGLTETSVCMRFEIVTAVFLKISVSWGVMLRHWVNSFWRFKGADCLRLNVEDTVVLWNIMSYTSSNASSHTRRLECVDFICINYCKMLLKAYVLVKFICSQLFTDPTGCLLHVITEDQTEPIWVASHCSLLWVSHSPGSVPSCVGPGGPPCIPSTSFWDCSS
jgi:hypothetical protein